MDHVNVMIDIETLGTSPGSSILAIGAATFYSPLTAQHMYYEKISRDSNTAIGLKEDPNTIAWWESQSAKAREESFSGTKDISEVLLEFSAWLKEFKYPVAVWGNGADFDMVLLAAAYKAADLELPWSYRDVRCYRTVKNMFPYVTALQFEGTKHTALADAAHQAAHAEAILGWIERCRRA